MKWNNDKIDGLRPRTMKYVDSRLDRITFGNPLNKMIKIFLHRVKSMLKKKMIQYFKSISNIMR